LFVVVIILHYTVRWWHSIWLPRGQGLPILGRFRGRQAACLFQGVL